MRKNGHGEIKLTNPVNIPSYRTRADKNKASDKEFKAFLERIKGNLMICIRLELKRR